MLYIIRHGKTDWNARYKLQGNTDIPLNDEGRSQARAAAAKYADRHFDICFCSPLVRAQETARLLLEGRDIEIVTDSRIREIGFGVYEGAERIFEQPDCPIYNFFKAPEKYIPPEGAESFEQLYARVGSFLKERVEPLLAEHRDVLIVGHGAMNSAIVAISKKIPPEKFWSMGIPNCELIELGGEELLPLYSE